MRLHLFRDNECHIQCSRYQRFEERNLSYITQKCGTCNNMNCKITFQNTLERYLMPRSQRTVTITDGSFEEKNYIQKGKHWTLQKGQNLDAVGNSDGCLCVQPSTATNLQNIDGKLVFSIKYPMGCLWAQCVLWSSGPKGYEECSFHKKLYSIHCSATHSLTWFSWKELHKIWSEFDRQTSSNTIRPSALASRWHMQKASWSDTRSTWIIFVHVFMIYQKPLPSQRAFM